MTFSKYFMFFIFSISAFFANHLFAQVGINTNSPDASSVLDIRSNNAGLLIPRLQLRGINYASPVNNPATGLLVYNTNTENDVSPGFYFWENNRWNYNREIKLYIN